MKQFTICPKCGEIELRSIDFPFICQCQKCGLKYLWRKPAKAISIRQPWAYLIASGLKDIES